jgi:hypothetical protein
VSDLFLAVWNGKQAWLLHADSKKTFRFFHDGKCLCLQPEKENRSGIHQKQGYFYSWIAPGSTGCISVSQSFVFSRSPKTGAHISSLHFRITETKTGLVIEDCSKNGTYVNGTRLIKGVSCLLEWNDWIFAGGYLFLCAGKYLITNAPLPFEKPEYSKRSECIEPKEFCYLQKPPLEKIRVEAPVLASDQTVSTAASLMPAISMAAASLTSAAVMMLTTQSASIMPMLASSCAMGAAMTGCTLISARVRKKSALKQKQQKEERYASYLAGIEKEIAARRMQLRQEFEEQKELTLSFGLRPERKNAWLLPCSHIPVQIFELQTPQTSYEHADKKESRQLKNLQESALWTLAWACIEENGFYFLAGTSQMQLEWLFAFWCFHAADKDMRFVSIGISLVCMENHPNCFCKDTFLHFESISQAMPVLKNFPDYSWTLLCGKEVSPASLEQLQTRFEGRITLISLARHPKAQVIRSLIFPQELSYLPALQKQVRKSALIAPQESVYDWRNDLGRKPLSSFRSSLANLGVQLDAANFWDLESDGPHVLIAGTTGSGKSEGMISVLLDLALHNTPHQLQYLLIDYKGGSFSGSLAALPHCAGIMSNLQQGALQRIAGALQMELERRQKCFESWIAGTPDAKADLAHYNKAHAESISHLLIVIDEFAELKQKHPEFMQQIQNIARVGRSLGFHLILSTQKPSGVVDDQTWSNISSILCFKVNSPLQSRELLQCDDAVKLQRPGEFVLKTSSAKVQGQIYYAKMPAGNTGSVCELSKSGKIFRNLPKPQTFLQQAAEIICQNDQKGRAVLAEDPFDKAEKLSFPVCDFLCKVEELQSPKRNAVICAQKPHSSHIALWLAALISRQRHIPVCSASESVFGTVQILSAGGLWLLTKLNQPCILLWQDPDVKSSLFQKLAENPEIFVIAVFGGIPYSIQTLSEAFDTRIVCGSQSREAQMLLFGKPVSYAAEFPACALWQSSLSARCIFPASSAEIEHCQKLADLPLEIRNDTLLPECLYIGWSKEEQTPFIFSPNTPIALFIASEQAQRQVEFLFSIWPKHLQSQILVSDCRKAKPDLSNQCDLLWIGEGLLQYGSAAGFTPALCEANQAVYKSAKGQKTILLCHPA